MKLRVIFTLILFLSSIFGPFWLTALLVLFGIIYFKLFWEGVIILLISDFFFGVSEARYNNLTYIAFITSLVVLVIAEVVKRKMIIKDYL